MYYIVLHDRNLNVKMQVASKKKNTADDATVVLQSKLKQLAPASSWLLYDFTKLIDAVSLAKDVLSKAITCLTSNPSSGIFSCFTQRLVVAFTLQIKTDLDSHDNIQIGTCCNILGGCYLFFNQL